jgi:hypothetical protein
MPKKHSEAETARIALAKAQGQRVYISGLSGHHTLETGVAYHYRGHYVYSYPQGMPIDPVPFQTKQGINIRANPLHSALPYDPNAPGLVSESSINALNKTWGAMWKEQKSEEEMRKKEVAEAIEDEEGHLGSKALSELPAMPYATSLVPTQVSSRMGSRVGSRTDLSSLAVPTLRRSSSRPGSSSASFAAHDAHSRSSSTSLAVFDTNAGYTRSSSATIPGLGHSASHPDLQASSSSLTTLGRDFGNLHLQVPQPNAGTAPSRPSLSAYAPSSVYGENIYDSLSRLRNDFYTPHDRARFLSDSAPGSRLASTTATPYTSRPVSPSHQHPRALNTLRQVASTTRLSQLLAEDLTPRAFSPLSAVEGNTTLPATNNGQPGTHTNISAEEASAIGAASEMSSPPYSRNKPIGTGRPRRASIALNQAHNAAKDTRRPCALHGEECDGVSVVETWKTRHAEETTGFKEPVPVVKGAGERVMVDWARLLKEEQMRKWG